MLDVIPLDASLVKGSHGRDRVEVTEQPLIIGLGAKAVSTAEEVFGYLKSRALAQD